MNQIYKLVGIIVSIDNKNIHLNLQDEILKSTQCIEDNTIEKINRLDKQLINKVSKLQYNEDINMIKTCKPIYYKYFNNNGKQIKNMYVKLIIPKLFNLRNLHFKKETMLGSLVIAHVKPSIYNFTDPNNKEKKIRGWKLQLMAIQKLK